MRINSTRSCIIRCIAMLKEGQMFATRNVLCYGSRAAVDQALSRLVDEGRIRRLIRGVFMRNDPGVPDPSIEEITAFKMEVFGRRAFTSAKNAAIKLGLIKEEKEDPNSFATNARSTSFRYKAMRISIKGMALRKLKLGDTRVGLFIRAMWHFGKYGLTNEIYRKGIDLLGSNEVLELRNNIILMPWWMSHFQTRFGVKWLGGLQQP